MTRTRPNGRILKAPHNILRIVCAATVLSIGTLARAKDASTIKESFVRIFVAPDRFMPTLQSYIAATGGHCSMHFPFPERRLELAAVSSPRASFLIIAGEPDELERFRATAVTFHVMDLDAAIAGATKGGATVLQQRTDVPTGLQARVKMPDGLVIELVEHNEAAHRFYHCRDLPLD